MEQHMQTKTHRILVGSPIHQKPEILVEFLNSLLQLRHDTLTLDFMFVDDNMNPQSSALLREFQNLSGNVTILPGEQQDEYKTDEMSHHWTFQQMHKVAAFKNTIIQKAIEQEYDYLFFVDSDLLLHPLTIEHLLSCEKDIISEVFWTKWEPNAPELPQVWMCDQYEFYNRNYYQNMTDEQEVRVVTGFIEMLRVPGVYQVGGLGACTLISRKALLAGNNFNEIKNISLTGEDRYFCIRAEALGFPLHVDTHYPAYHIYRTDDLQGVAAYKEANLTREQSNDELLITHALQEAMCGLGTFNYTHGYEQNWQVHVTDSLREKLLEQILGELDRSVQNQLVTVTVVPKLQIVSMDERQATVEFLMDSAGIENGVRYEEQTWFGATLLKNQYGNWQVDQFAPLAVQK